MELPSLPSDFASVIPILNTTTSQTEVRDRIKPYADYEAKLRQIYAQYPDHEAVKTEHLVPIFDNEQLLVKARNLAAESDSEKEKYLLPLQDSQRNENGSPATVSHLKNFKTNFSLFSEQSLVDLDWSNVVAAGSSVVTSLLPVNAPHNTSKRALRAYYHQQLAPASDVDLFIYGLNEEQALEKIKQIETCIRDSVLAETTMIRTKNAITIASEYPTRHVQIVLRLYKSVTEILTGFDVDCSCVAYDGKQVWASPRALAAFATQQNTIDLTRRSPSYENRLSKYAHRGFEVYWPLIDRTRIDPTIYERAFNRVLGLARLLVLEKLPHPNERDAYADKRRRERGRPELPWNARYRHALPGNVKDAQPDDVPDWLENAEHSDYHTFTIPYGPKYNAKKIEKLLFKQDLLLNAEWNKPKDRETDLHRHPAFFGSVDDVFQDCCGFCPEPVSDEDLKAHDEESKIYISGKLRFMKDDPGRQAIGSFNPLTNDDWTDMAYIGSSPRLCQAIVDNDLQAIHDWFNEAGADVNRRDQTGRTPLQLACMCASPDIVQLLIDRGARIVSRIYNGMTALHMASHRGNTKIVKLLLEKSEANEKEENRREESRKVARRAAFRSGEDVETNQNDDQDIEMVEDDEESDQDDAMTEGSYVKVKERMLDENDDEPDIYNVDVLAWDNPVSALHLAIMGGHVEVINLLIDTFGADAMLPVKLKGEHHGPKAILNMLLTIHLASHKANETIHTLLRHGASPAQADAHQITNVHHLVNEAKVQILDMLNEEKPEATKSVINHLTMGGWTHNVQVDSPLYTAIRLGFPDLVRKVLEIGAKPTTNAESFVKSYVQKFENGEKDAERLKVLHTTSVEQPIIEMARRHRLVDIISELLDSGIDVNTLTKDAHKLLSGEQNHYNLEPKSLLDIVRDRIQELSEYGSGKDSKPQKPNDLPAFINTNCGKYESWLLQTSYAQAETIHVEHMKKYATEMEKYYKDDDKNDFEKGKAIDEMREKWTDLEKKLVKKGAKTYEKLHPKAKKNDDGYRPYRWQPGRSGRDRDRPWDNRVSFHVPDLTDEKRDRYIELFEAVFEGNEGLVKKICLDTRNPLQVAVVDTANYNPFALAVVRGHYGLARTILDIAAVQYQPPKEEAKTYRYHLHRPRNDAEYYSDEEADSHDEDDMKVYSELIDENYTIDDIRLISDNVKSKTSPALLFAMGCELWRTSSMSGPEAKAMFRPDVANRYFNGYYDDEKTPAAWFREMNEREQVRNTFGLFRYAVANNDTTMLKFLLDLQRDLIYRKEDENSLFKLQLRSDDFDLALRLGHTEIVSEIVRSTGTLLPVAKLAEKSGISLNQKSEYYQGLSVYGQKRQDWTQQDQGLRDRSNSDHGSPLLAAVLSGNIKSVEYFLSDTPLRCYEEFTQTFKHNKHIELLAQAEGGIERALHSWMDTRTNLVIHMAIMADPEISKPVRDFVIKRMPQYINAKSKTGVSPLQVAFELKHYDAVKELIDAGADQTTRNASKENLLHTIYMNRDEPLKVDSLQKVVGMLNPDIVPSLCTQRSSGDGREAQTPLMKFLWTHHSSNECQGIVSAMLKYSGEKDLEVMDGTGDFPLHALVRGSTFIDKTIKYIARRRPDLLFRENAIGQTPVEIIESTFLRSFMESPPQVNIHQNWLTQNITEVPADSFPEDLQANLETKSKSYSGRFYEQLSAIANQHPRRRALVSLLDANEIARRLADQQHRANEDMKRREALGRTSYSHAYYQYEENQNEAGDEVSLWMAKAIADRKTQ